MRIEVEDTEDQQDVSAQGFSPIAASKWAQDLGLSKGLHSQSIGSPPDVGAKPLKRGQPKTLAAPQLQDGVKDKELEAVLRTFRGGQASRQHRCSDGCLVSRL